MSLEFAYYKGEVYLMQKFSLRGGVHHVDSWDLPGKKENGSVECMQFVPK